MIPLTSRLLSDGPEKEEKKEHPAWRHGDKATEAHFYRREEEIGNEKESVRKSLRF